MTERERDPRVAIVGEPDGWTALSPALSDLPRVRPSRSACALRLAGPDVVLYPIDFEDAARSLAGLARTAARHPVVVVSASTLREDLEIARRCGARGHLRADCSANDVRAAARQVMAGRHVWPDTAESWDDTVSVRGLLRGRGPWPADAVLLTVAALLTVTVSGPAAAAAHVTAVVASAAAGGGTWQALRASRRLDAAVLDAMPAYVRGRERARYSRLLHDNVLQTMESLVTSPNLDDHRVRRHLAAETAWLRRLIEEPDPRPPVDLPTALARAVESFRDRALTVDLDLGRIPAMMPCPVPPPVTDAIVGSVTAALGNVVRHAGVDTASVAVTYDARGLEVTVTDRGRGFTADAALGFGLRHSIGGRMAEVGGRCRITARPGHGTVVTLICPVTAVGPTAVGPTTADLIEAGAAREARA